MKASLQEAEEKAAQDRKAGSCGALPVRRQNQVLLLSRHQGNRKNKDTVLAAHELADPQPRENHCRTKTDRNQVEKHGD